MKISRQLTPICWSEYYTCLFNKLYSELLRYIFLLEGLGLPGFSKSGYTRFCTRFCKQFFSLSSESWHRKQGRSILIVKKQNDSNCAHLQYPNYYYYYYYFFLKVVLNRSSFTLLISIIFTVHIFNTIHTSQGRVDMT